MHAKSGIATRLDFGEGPPQEPSGRTRALKRANELDGATWTRYSLSVWADLKKSPDEFALRHPAMFPVMLVRRLIQCFTTQNDYVVLDPFSGSGSTLIGAMMENKKGLGLEIVPSYIELVKHRIAGRHLPFDGKERPTPVVYQQDARELLSVVPANSVDLCITSPPYWDILSQKRTADYKRTRDYGDEIKDLAKVHGYWEFINELGRAFDQVYRALKPGKYCIVDVMDLRKKNRFFPFHSDLTARLKTSGFALDDIIIWDRRQEYNNLRPLGYPSVFRVNKVHEYLLIFQKAPLESET